MICSNTDAFKTWCNLIAIKHIAKQNCAEYSDVMQQHRPFFFVKTPETTWVYCVVILWSITHDDGKNLQTNTHQKLTIFTMPQPTVR